MIVERFEYIKLEFLIAQRKFWIRAVFDYASDHAINFLLSNLSSTRYFESKEGSFAYIRTIFPINVIDDVISDVTN